MRLNIYGYNNYINTVNKYHNKILCIESINVLEFSSRTVCSECSTTVTVDTQTESLSDMNECKGTPVMVNIL